MSSPILLQPQQELLLCDDDLPLLTAHAVLPCREERPSRFFNSYYRRCYRFFEERCRRDWFPAAQEAFRHALESAAPIPQWQARLDADVTLQQAQLVSLRLDTVLVTEAKQQRFLQGDLWDLRTGLPLALSDCFPPRSRWRRRLLRHAADSIQAQEAHFHPAWRQALPRAFRPRNFYLTEEGLCFFFPPGTIAPASAGCPTFCLPYDNKAGPFVPKT